MNPPVLLNRPKYSSTPLRVRVAMYLRLVGGHAPLRELSHAAPRDQADADDDHGKREQLPHRPPRAEEVADLYVGKAHELDEDAEDAVEREEGAQEEPTRTRGVRLARQGEEHEEDDETLKERLVELRGMVHDARPREIDTDGQGRGCAVQFAIHEVRAAPEEKAKGNAARDEVGQGEKRNVVDERVYDARDHDADEPTVEGHPPVTEGEDFHRVGEVITVTVEKAVAEPRADDDAEGAIAHEDEDVIAGEAKLPVPGVEIHDEAGEDEAHDVGNSVPPHGKRTDGDDNRIDELVDIV